MYYRRGSGPEFLVDEFAHGNLPADQFGEGGFGEHATAQAGEAVRAIAIAEGHRSGATQGVDGHLAGAVAVAGVEVDHCLSFVDALSMAHLADLCKRPCATLPTGLAPGAVVRLYYLGLSGGR